MRKKISVGAALAVTLLCCLATFQVTYLVSRTSFERRYLSETLNAVNSARGSVSAQAQTAAQDSAYAGDVQGEESSDFMTKLTSRISEVDALFRGYYIDDIDDEFLMDCVLDGYIAGTKDAYGAYYNAADFDAFMDDMGGEVVGIGVNVIYNTEYQCIEVLNVVPDSPALEAGILPGDLIWTVGEEREPVPTLGYYPAIGKLRGEAGTVAIFSVLRGEGSEKEELDFRITRARVTEITVMSHIYGPDASVGVVRITGFDATTPVQFVQAVESLRAEGCEKLVVDLRYNPGGELSSIVTTLDYILPEGPIVRIMDAQRLLLRGHGAGYAHGGAGERIHGFRGGALHLGGQGLSEGGHRGHHHLRQGVHADHHPPVLRRCGLHHLPHVQSALLRQLPRRRHHTGRGGGAGRGPGGQEYL